MKLTKLLKRDFKRLGPGFITGASDDDPSGVATFSIVGAQFGYKLNWLYLLLLPMMITIQEMCGRIGMCSGMGLAGVIKKYHSKRILYSAVGLLLIANVINISADLGFMAACLQMIIKVPFLLWLAAVTAITIIMEIVIPYKKYANYLKWLSLTLLVYGVTAFITKQDWSAVLKNTLIPHFEFNLTYIMAIVGFSGTTISPYLFFWQTSEEVEEEIVSGQVKDFANKPILKRDSIKYLQKDTMIGMVFSNIISFFIVLTTAATLFANGIHDIETPYQAAMALKPLAGNFAFTLFTIGIIGIGLQSVPVLSGCIGYALSEAFGQKEGLGKTFKKAHFFYIVIGLATAIGALMNVIGINPMKALYYTAIINGLVSVPLIAIIIKLSDDERVVGEHKNSKLKKIIGWCTFLFMLLAACLLFISIIF